MRTVILTAVAFIAIPPLGARGQEEPAQAEILSISSYQCPLDAIQSISDEYDRLTRPIEEALVEEGKLAGAGLYFHFWADEWNVNYYRLGYELNALLDAINEVGERFAAENPELADGPGAFGVCTAHKDGIYTFGPGTGRTPPPGTGG